MRESKELKCAVPTQYWVGNRVDNLYFHWRNKIFAQRMITKMLNWLYSSKNISSLPKLWLGANESVSTKFSYLELNSKINSRNLKYSHKPWMAKQKLISRSFSYKSVSKSLWDLSSKFLVYSTFSHSTNMNGTLSMGWICRMQELKTQSMPSHSHIDRHGIYSEPRVTIHWDI